VVLETGIEDKGVKKAIASVALLHYPRLQPTVNKKRQRAESKAEGRRNLPDAEGRSDKSDLSWSKGNNPLLEDYIKALCLLPSTKS
jgi:hypothetical protein